MGMTDQSSWIAFARLTTCTLQVILPEGCTTANPGLSNCANERGYLFSSNESISWSTSRLPNEGLFNLITFEEGLLGLTGNANYGFDTITLGLQGSGLPTLQKQLVAGIATNNYWLGSLGLSPVPFNFTDLNDPIPSLLTNLKTEGHIPSLSWGYTAGASYQDPPVYGSLVLGGYDTTRFSISNTLPNIPFGADFSRDLLVSLQSITFDTVGSSPLLASSIYVFVDSMVSHLYLPIQVCLAFEQAFDLTWNETNQLYLVNETVHSALLDQNPTFTFTFTSAGQNVDITIPYAAFDLEISEIAIVSGTNGYAPKGTSTDKSRYFPLKQARNDSQYTLGRVFLQEAYITADYERHNFSISQAEFPSTSVQENLVPILPASAETDDSNRSSISGGAIAGIVIGAVVILAVAALVIWFLRRNKRKARQPPDPTVYSELPKHHGHELDDVDHRRFEMENTDARRELEGYDGGINRYKDSRRAYEMGAKETPAAELEGSSWRR